MKGNEKFCRSLAVLEEYNETLLQTNEIYRIGMMVQFHLTFDLAWRLLQKVLIQHSVAQAATGFPREIVKLGFQYGFLSDEMIWLEMLDKRRLLPYVYEKEIAEEIIVPLIEDFIPALGRFRDSIVEKIIGRDQFLVGFRISK